MKFKYVGPNYVLKLDKGYASFNSSPGDSGLEAIASLISGKDMTVKGSETALYDGETWYILNGDFRAQFEAAGTFDECFKIYQANQDRRSDWSTDDLD